MSGNLFKMAQFEIGGKTTEYVLPITALMEIIWEYHGVFVQISKYDLSSMFILESNQALVWLENGSIQMHYYYYKARNVVRRCPLVNIFSKSISSDIF